LQEVNSFRVHNPKESLISSNSFTFPTYHFPWNTQLNNLHPHIIQQAAGVDVSSKAQTLFFSILKIPQIKEGDFCDFF